MKKNFRILLISLVFSVLIGANIGGYYVYKNKIIFPDNESEQIIKNMNSNNITILSESESVVDQFNNAVKSFGGIENLTLDGNNIKINFDGDNLFQYRLIYSSKVNKIYGDYEKYYQYMCENYKYYNEDRIAINLEMYSCYNDNDLSVDDIKKYVNEGDKSKREEIYKYIEWYKNYGYCLYDKYDLEYMKKIHEENGNGEYTEKYSGNILDDLSIEEQKEVIKDLYNKGLVK